MENKLTSAERDHLDEVWRRQSPVDGPALDFQNLYFPAAWARAEDGNRPTPTVEQAEELIQKTLGWPDWVRVYAKPIMAVMAASPAGPSKRAARRGALGGPGHRQPLPAGQWRARSGHPAGRLGPGRPEHAPGPGRDR